MACPQSQQTACSGWRSRRRRSRVTVFFQRLLSMRLLVVMCAPECEDGLAVVCCGCWLCCGFSYAFFCVASDCFACAVEYFADCVFGEAEALCEVAYAFAGVAVLLDELAVFVWGEFALSGVVVLSDGAVFELGVVVVAESESECVGCGLGV